MIETLFTMFCCYCVPHKWAVNIAVWCYYHRFVTARPKYTWPAPVYRAWLIANGQLKCELEDTGMFKRE